MISAFAPFWLTVCMSSRNIWLAGIVTIGCMVPLSAEAATLYWVGNDGASTSVASNWKTTDPASCGSGNASAAPTTTDTIIFDRDCDNGAVVNSSLTVTTTTFQNGYAGIVSLNTSFTSTTFTQSGGTFQLNGQTFTNAGAITLNTGSTFTAGTGTVALTSGSVTINVDSTLSLYNLMIDGTTATTKTISNSDTLIVTNTLTLTDGLVSQTTIPAAGTIQAQGAIVQASTFDGGTARIEATGTGDQTFTGNATRTAGLLPLFRMNKSTGTLTLSGTIRTANNWNYSGGTLAFTNSTVVFGDAALSINGSHSLSNVIFDQNSATARTYTVKSDTTLIVNGTLTIDNSSTAIITINGGFIRSRGNISLPDSTMNHTGTTNLIIDGTSDQLLSGNATNSTGGLIPLNINKASGTLTLSGTIRTAKTWSYSGGTIDPGTSTVVFGATLTIAGSHTLNNVRFDGYKTAMTVTITSATTLTVNGGLTLDQGANAGVITMNTGTMYAKRDVTIADTLTHTGTAQLYINGTADQLLSSNSTNRIGDLIALTIDKPSGTLTLSGTIRTTKNWTYALGTLDATTNLSTVVFAGTQQLSGTHTLYNVTLTGSYASHTVQTGGTIITAAGTLTLSDGYVRGGILEATGDVVYESPFDGGNGTLRLSGNTVRTLTLAANDELPGLSITGPNVTMTAPSTGNMYIRGSYSQSAGTFNGQGSDVHITGDVSVSGGTFTAPSGTLTIIGTFTRTAGTFNHNSGEVILSASGRILTPPSSFHDVTLSEGLMAYWKFDETSGTTAADSSGFGHHGTYVGDPLYSSEYSSNHQFSNGGSLSLSGNDYIDMGDIEGLESTFSLSIWIKSVGASGMLMTKSVENTSTARKKQWALYTNDEPELWVFPPGSGTAVEQRSLTRMDDDEWHHVAAMYDAQNRQMFIYVDGDLTDGTLTSSNLPNYTYNSIQQVMIGAYINASSNPAIFFTGLIDEARIYNRVLSSAEVAALADGTQFPTVDYTLGASLVVADTLTLNHVDLDPSDNCYDIEYGSLTNSGGTIGSCRGSSGGSTATTTSTTSTSPSLVRGGGRGGIGPGARSTEGAKARAAIGASWRATPAKATSVKTTVGKKSVSQIRRILRVRTISTPSFLRKRSMINRLPHAFKAR